VDGEVLKEITRRSRDLSHFRVTVEDVSVVGSVMRADCAKPVTSRAAPSRIERDRQDAYPTLLVGMRATNYQWKTVGLGTSLIWKPSVTDRQARCLSYST
jgi:hypothetical protein